MDVDECTQIDNQMLETAFATQQTMAIICRKTNVNPYEFELRHKEIVIYKNKRRENFYYDAFKYVCKQFTFWS